jgi:phosphonate transport system substrate-binding protein
MWAVRRRPPGSRVLFSVLLLASICAAGDGVRERAPLLFGITPVFLIDQGRFLEGWNRYLSERLNRPVDFLRRKTYAEISDLLLNGELDAAWICSLSYVFNRASLRAVAIPVFRGEPYYRSYLIVPAVDSKTSGYGDLEGKVFAYVEPRSNTGYLYPRYAVAQLGKDPSRFFRETFFTWSHPDSVYAVAERVADAAAVDSYIWESLKLSDPTLTAKTRVVDASRSFGFPPVVAGVLLDEPGREQLTQVLLEMSDDAEGRRLLGLLHLDRFVEPRDDLYDGIPAMIEAVMPVTD